MLVCVCVHNRLAFPVLSLDAKFGMLIWLRHTLLYPLTTLTEGDEYRPARVCVCTQLLVFFFYSFIHVH